MAAPNDSFPPVISRISGRVVTGPAAFLLAWIADLSAYGIAVARRRLAGPRER
jgi:hypothetical protein